MSFGNDMKKIAKAMGGDVVSHQKALTITIFNGVILKTRVDTGRARGNWQTTVGTPATNQIERYYPEGTPEDAMKAEPLAMFKPASLMILSNNVPYIGRLEELDGMVGSEIARAERNIRDTARKL